MFSVLLESRAPRARRAGSTMASALLHGALIAGAVALARPRQGNAVPSERTHGDTLIYVVSKRPHGPPPVASRRPSRSDQAATPPVLPAPRRIDVPTGALDHLPPLDVGPVLNDDLRIGGPARPLGGTPETGLRALSDAPGAPLDELLVDRAPRLVGRAVEPRYPERLREAGIEGRVVVQFVVDTLGRAELADLQTIGEPHPLFVDAVRAALARYRFTPGEAAGRRVRTRVQIPFDFTLAR
jgi:protein TonB